MKNIYKYDINVLFTVTVCSPSIKIMKIHTMLIFIPVRNLVRIFCEYLENLRIQLKTLSEILSGKFIVACIYIYIYIRIIKTVKTD